MQDSEKKTNKILYINIYFVPCNVKVIEILDATI